MAQQLIELSITPDYVPEWGLWEAIRELVQNAKDVEDSEPGATANIHYDEKLQILTIDNDKVCVTREQLLIGNTSKRGTEQRGQFGEGMKLAFLVLARNGYVVSLVSGSELWIPTIRKSDKFNSDVLTIICKASSQRYSGTTVTVTGIAKEVWDQVSVRFLWMTPERAYKRQKDSPGSSWHSDGPSKAFCKGIYICDLPTAKFSYDFEQVKLNRDRGVPDIHSVRTNMHLVLSDKLLPEELYKLINEEPQTEEAQSVFYSGTSSEHDCLYNEFIKRHGKDHYPVATQDEIAQYEYYGVPTVMVSGPLYRTIRYKWPTFAEVTRNAGTKIVKFWETPELTAEENDNWAWALNMVLPWRSHYNVVAVVDFESKKVCGTRHSNNNVAVAKSQLANRANLIATLVHEIAHHAGGDLTVEHRNECEKMFGEIIAKCGAV